MRKGSLLVLLILIGASGGFVFTASAQTSPSPSLIVTWKARAYVPASYQMKIFPPRNAVVDMHLMLLDGNQPADLSKTEIRWSVNGRFLASGAGLTKTSFTLDQFLTRTYKVKVQISEFKGKAFEKIIDIKRADPKVIIFSNGADNTLTGELAGLVAVPYFFLPTNDFEFGFAWNIDGQSLSNRLNTAVLNLASAQNNQIVTASVTVKSNNNALEQAAVSKQFRVVK